MSESPRSPKVLKAGLVLLEPDSGAVRRVITLQYNPDSLTRSLQLQGAGSEGGDRMEALRLKGPPVETFNLEAELDATDQLEFPDKHRASVAVGIAHQLAALETMLYPSTAELLRGNALASLGAIEILPATASLTLFVWGRSRVLPVRLTEFNIVEESFDTSLNPLRAKITLGLRVLSINDLPFSSRGGSLYLIYQRMKEQLATRSAGGRLQELGLGGISNE
jgi:hypothetical protein